MKERFQESVYVDSVETEKSAPRAQRSLFAFEKVHVPIGFFSFFRRIFLCPAAIAVDSESLAAGRP